MRDYLTFESECERLSKYFLLEGVGNDDDLEEATNNDEDTGDTGNPEEKSGDGDTEEKPEDGEKPEDPKEETEDSDALADLDGDSDLDDITGNPGDAPSADEVNKEDGAPGAINPENLLKELAEGDDNVYTRVAKAMQERYPNGCSVKDVKEPLEKTVAHAVKAFMKNKNYAPLPKEAMKGVCDNISNTILEKCTGKKSNEAKEQAPKAPAANEAVYYVKKAPVFESAELMESFWKNAAAAAAIGMAGANTANAATAESAPYATKAGTPLYQEFQRQADAKAEQKKAEVNKANAKSNQSSAASSSSAPNVKNPASVTFSGDSTYTLTPEQYEKFKAADNLPAHYKVSDGKSKAADGGKAEKEVKKSGAGATTQAAVKTATKSSVNKGGKSKGYSGERCAVPQEEKSESWGKKLHRWAHKAVDKGGEIGAGIVGGAVGAAKGLYQGANTGYSKAKNALEKDHDEMIAERGHH